MRNTRKGFTLVELLIVVAILGTLSASMVIATADATASAKASAIANNVAACKNGAALYYLKTFNDATATSTAASFLCDNSEYVPNWDDFATGGTITYRADSTNTTPETWTVTVDFSGDKEKVKIATALGKMPGYKSVTASTTSFTVTLLTGKVTAGTTGGSGGD